MPHVSPQSVSRSILAKLYEHFFSSVTGRRASRKEHRLFFNELLTPTEKVMLGKRLTAIVALSQGAGTFRVSKALRLSMTTTAKLQRKLDRGDFKHIVKLCALERKGEIGYFFENLFRPLPRYGTSPTRVLKEE